MELTGTRSAASHPYAADRMVDRLWGHIYSQGAGEYFFDWAHFQQMLLDLTAMERQLVD